MGNEQQIELTELLIRDANNLREKLQNTSGTEFEPNVSEKRRISTNIKGARKKVSSSIHTI